MLTRTPATPPDINSPLSPASDLMHGLPIGRVFQGPPSPPLATADAREQALRVLALFISRLVFTHEPDVAGSPPVRFSVQRDHVHIYQPDELVQAPARDGIGVLPGRADHVPYGLGPSVILDDTADRFGQGTVLARRGDHVETIGLEVVAAKHPIRLAIVAGLKAALTLDAGSGALRLRLPDYYCLVASFVLMQSEQLDDEDAALNRRRGHLFVQMTVPEVTLVRYAKTVVVPGAIVERVAASDET